MFNTIVRKTWHSGVKMNDKQKRYLSHDMKTFITHAAVQFLLKKVNVWFPFVMIAMQIVFQNKKQ